jgi:pimeloyl-ACP methyl ester carboxylesterase
VDAGVAARVLPEQLNPGRASSTAAFRNIGDKKMKLATWTVGNGPRTAALVHGASMGGAVWRDFARILVDDYDLTVVLLDQRGHGASPRATSYKVADFAGDLVDTLPKGLDFYIGQSLGGLVGAWAAARLQPKRYIGLDPAFAVSAFSAFLLGKMGPLQPRMSDRMLRAFGVPVKGSPPDTLERFRAMWKNWDTSMMGQLVSTGRREPFPVGAPAVPSTLVIADKSFCVSDKMATGLRAAGWDVRVKPGAEHDLHLQDPRGVIAMLDDVLRAKA